MVEVHVEVLNSTYQEVYESLGKNDGALLKFFELMSGQQINLPVHLYDGIKVKSLVAEKAELGEVNVDEEAKRYGFSRRWIRNAVKQSKRMNLKLK